MKHSVLRICSACLLLTIALALTVGVIAAVTQTPQAAWTSVRFVSRGEQSLCIYDAQGKLLETLQTDETGVATSSLLPAGEYYAACLDGFAGFCLENNGAMHIISGGASAEGSTLYFAHAQLGTLCITGTAKQQWYDFLLIGETYRRREVVRCKDGEVIECIFGGLPYGSYALEENGVLLCNVSISAEQPSVVLHLP